VFKQIESGAVGQCKGKVFKQIEWRKSGGREKQQIDFG